MKLAAAALAEVFRFRLFVAGDTPNSTLAWTNLSALCAELLPNRHEIEVIDVFREPQRALNEGIFMTPMLLKLSPGTPSRIVGTLSDTNLVSQSLGFAKAQ